MRPIFDKRAQLVGWLDGQHIFDLDLKWIAFTSGGHVFSAKKLEWLGPFHDGSFLDTNGKPVAWLADSSPSGTLKPLTPTRPPVPLKPLKPLRPSTPLRPLKPPQPISGWSDLDWSGWFTV